MQPKDTANNVVKSQVSPLEQPIKSSTDNEPFTPDNPEIVIGFVGAVGVNLERAEDASEKMLKSLGYEVVRIRVSQDIFPQINPSISGKNFKNKYDRIKAMMDIGSKARDDFGADIVALGVASEIFKRRPKLKKKKTAYFVNSLKHPVEVRRLRELYPWGFYLIGVHAPPESRKKYLLSLPGVGLPEAEELMLRDKKEEIETGQQLVETFHLSDFFAGWEESDDPNIQSRNVTMLNNSIERFFEIMFGHPNRTPTFGEYAMFQAFSNALRSADLSRQVGAVVARNGEIIGVGANDCPRAGGGLYWPTLDLEKMKFEDFSDGRDYKRKEDSNRKAQIDIIQDVAEIVHEEMVKGLRRRFTRQRISKKNIKKLEEGLFKDLEKTLLIDSRIADLTEFGRVVHAEMEALLSCARKGVSTVGATLYTTTFPCHNCAKHILAAGIRRVVFIEPYLKSRALAFHDEAIEIVYPSFSNLNSPNNTQTINSKVRFEPFFGVGPRKYFALFSMEIGTGRKLERKNKTTGDSTEWTAEKAKIRLQMMKDSYLDREKKAAERFKKLNSKKAKTLISKKPSKRS